MVYFEGLLKFYALDGRLMKVLICAKITNISMEKLDTEFIFVISYRSYEKIIFKSKKEEKIASSFKELDDIFKQIDLIKFNLNKISVVDEKQSYQDTKFFKKTFCEKGYFLLKPSSFPKLDMEFYKDYKYHEFLIESEIEDWIEYNPNNIVSQRTMSLGK